VKTGPGQRRDKQLVSWINIISPLPRRKNAPFSRPDLPRSSGNILTSNIFFFSTALSFSSASVPLKSEFLRARVQLAVERNYLSLNSRALLSRNRIAALRFLAGAARYKSPGCISCFVAISFRCRGEVCRSLAALARILLRSSLVARPIPVHGLSSGQCTRTRTCTLHTYTNAESLSSAKFYDCMSRCNLRFGFDSRSSPI